MARTSTVFEVEPTILVEELAKKVKEIQEFKQPEWSLFVKTSVSKERPPEGDDWWYIRVASVLRQVYIKGIIGINRLKKKYGGKQDRGGKPEKFRKGSGKIIRTILQQAEKVGFVERVKEKIFGRRLTKKGKGFLEENTYHFLDQFDINLDITMRPTTSKGGGSDHSPFARKDVPFFYFMAGWHDEYHTPKDEVELVNYRKLSDIAKIGFLNIWTMANEPEL